MALARLHVEFSTTFGLVPTMLSGSRLIALVQERFALATADQTTLRRLEPPMPLQPAHQIMLWTGSAETDPGHAWLRHRIVSLVAKLDQAIGPQRSPGPSNQLAACDQPVALT